MPLPTSGVVVGPERYDDEGTFLGVNDVTLSLEHLRTLITWRNRREVEAWVKAAK
jgi:hypothetical protein